jgi:hypothetical protein
MHIGKQPPLAEAAPWIFALLVFALLLGWYGAKVFGLVGPTHIESDAFERAHWMMPRVSAPVAYFRKTIVISDVPTRAYLRIAAPDFFELYVNGAKLGDSTFLSAYTSDIFDIAPYLAPGKNVIAIKTARKTYPPVSEVAVSGLWRNDKTIHPLLSDATWRVAVREERQQNGETRWHDQAFDDQYWAKPLVSSHGARTIITQRPWLTEKVFEEAIGGFVIEPAQRGQDITATFRREFNIEGHRINNAWIGITGDGTYSLSVNNVSVSVASTTSNQYMDAYNIAELLRRGRNMIMVDVTTRKPNPRLVTAGTVEVDGQRYSLHSGSQWLSQTFDLISSTRTWSRATVRGAMQRVPVRWQLENRVPEPRGYPTLRPQVIEPSFAITLMGLRSMAPWLFAGLIVVGVSAWGYIRLYCRNSGAHWQKALISFSAPAMVAMLVLIMLVLVQFDIRIDPASVFMPRWFLGIVLLFVIWECLILFTVYERYRQAGMKINLAGQAGL